MTQLLVLTQFIILFIQLTATYHDRDNLNCSLAQHWLPVVAADVVESGPVVVESDVEGRDALLPVPTIRLRAVHTIH